MTSRKRACRLALTQRALDDLAEIERFSIRAWGRKTADKYLDDIDAALDRVRANPELLRQEPEFSAGLSFYRVKRHVLACDYRDDLVIVLAVIHASMDLPLRLHELEPRLAAEVQLLRTKLHGHRPNE